MKCKRCKRYKILMRYCRTCYKPTCRICRLPCHNCNKKVCNMGECKRKYCEICEKQLCKNCQIKYDDKIRCKICISK